MFPSGGFHHQPLRPVPGGLFPQDRRDTRPPRASRRAPIAGHGWVRRRAPFAKQWLDLLRKGLRRERRAARIRLPSALQAFVVALVVSLIKEPRRLGLSLLVATLSAVGQAALALSWRLVVLTRDSVSDLRRINIVRRDDPHFTGDTSLERDQLDHDLRYLRRWLTFYFQAAQPFRPPPPPAVPRPPPKGAPRVVTNPRRTPPSLTHQDMIRKAREGYDRILQEATDGLRAEIANLRHNIEATGPEILSTARRVAGNRALLLLEEFPPPLDRWERLTAIERLVGRPPSRRRRGLLQRLGERLRANSPGTLGPAQK